MIGAGGMGEVYRATNPKLGREARGFQPPVRPIDSSIEVLGRLIVIAIR